MKQLPEIVIIIPCWGRSEVYGLVCKQLDLFCTANADKVNLTVLHIFSPEDEELEKLKYIFTYSDHNRRVILTSNRWLGQKLNDGIQYARRFNFDYIMNLGSDDLLHPGLIDLYMPEILAKTPVFGINKLYFHSKNEEPVFFSDYNEPNLVGAGRMIHKDVVLSVTRRIGGLYTPDKQRGLDTDSAKRMHKVGYEQKTINPGEFPYVVDIKSEVNINSFQRILNCVDSGKRVQKASISKLTKEFEILKKYK